MSLFDGEPGELSFGQALVELARAGAFPSEAHRDQVVTAFEKEFSIGRQHPDTVAEVAKNRPADPRDAELNELRKAVAELKEQVAAAQAKEKPAEDPRDAELRELRAQLAGSSTTSDPDAGNPHVQGNA